MRVSCILSLALITALPIALNAQSEDSLNVGDRVRVRVGATRGANTNVFVGNVASISPETLVVAIPGDKGSITIPRSAINEVALSRGHRSHATNLIQAAPIVFFSVPLLTLPVLHGPHSNSLNIERYALMGFEALSVGRILGRRPAERWEPVYGWLEHP